MAGKKRSSTKQELLTRPELINKIKAIENIRDRALAAFLYLTGCRISEVLGTIKRVKKYKYEVVEGKRKKFIESTTIEKIEPLRKESIEYLPDKDLILVHQVSCLKRRLNVPRRNIPIIVSADSELVGIFGKYYNTLPDGSKLFPISRQRAWQIINKELGLYTHFLIHERCSHLVTYKNFTDLDLMQFRGWSNTSMASVYTHLNWQDIAEKMRK
jgi:integrase